MGKPSPSNNLSSPLRYRILNPEEWHRLLEIYPDDQQLPSPEVASAVVAEHDDHIVSVLFLQLAFHMEPMIINPNYRSRVNFLRLVSTLETAFGKALPEGQSGIYYVSAPKDSRIPAMARTAGMQSLDQELWAKVVEGQSPQSNGGPP
jgi:hypothetical protein